MNLKKILLIEYGIITLLTAAAIFNTRLELFNIGGIVGGLFTGLSIIFLPAHIGAMVMTNVADSPDLWGVLVGYSVQGLLMAFLTKRITVSLQK